MARDALRSMTGDDGIATVHVTGVTGARPVEREDTSMCLSGDLGVSDPLIGGLDAALLIGTNAVVGEDNCLEALCDRLATGTTGDSELLDDRVLL